MNTRVNKMQLGGYTFIGYSLAGEESVIGVPELNVCFDIGRSPSEILNIDNVLLTHGHMDHAAGIAYYFSQRNFLDNTGGNLVVPKELVAPIHRLMDAWREIEGHRTPYRVVGMSPNEEYSIRRGLVARTFQTIHGGPCLGYSIVEIRQKLKPEFLDMPGNQLADLRKKGVDLTYDLEVPLVCYCGDTAYGDFFQLDWVRKAKVLILECTFVEQDHRSRALAGYHLHREDFNRLQDQLENEFIMLVHLSRRTSLAAARQELKSCMRDDMYSRIHFLMSKAPNFRFKVTENSK